MNVPLLPVRPTPSIALWATVLASGAGIALGNLLVFSRPDGLSRRAHLATDGWVNENLVLFAPLTLLIVGGLVRGWGRQRLSDLGLRRGWAGQCLLALAAGWLAVQALAVAAALLAGGSLAPHPAWARHGAGAVLGLLIAMVLGTALFEDGVFRGYLLPQVYLRLGRWVGGHRTRAAAALLACALVFSLFHLPTILLNRDPSAPAVVGALAYMALGGLMLGLLYLRTGHLGIVIACHALVNAPTLLVASPVNGSLLAGLVGVAAVIAGPWLVGRRWSASLARPVEDVAAPDRRREGLAG